MPKSALAGRLGIVAGASKGGGPAVVDVHVGGSLAGNESAMASSTRDSSGDFALKGLFVMGQCGVQTTCRARARTCCRT